MYILYQQHPALAADPQLLQSYNANAIPLSASLCCRTRQMVLRRDTRGVQFLNETNLIEVLRLLEGRAVSREKGKVLATRPVVTEDSSLINGLS